jgi:NAT, N-acetyltransferase, of N-acetylglutamate synthase
VSASAPVSAAAEAVLTFLESVGRRSEAEFYLRLFLKLPPESFGIIAPGATVVRYALGSLVEQLKFLADLGLYAPVVLGLYDPEQGAASSERLVKRLPASGMEACPHEMGEPGLAEKLRAELRADRLPVVHFRASGGQTIDDRLNELGALTKELDTRKFVLLRRRGGLKPLRSGNLELAPGYYLPTESGRISIINLRTDRDGIVLGKTLPKRDSELLAAAERLIELSQPTPVLASITSPLNLLKELFTVKGAGTLIKLGSAVSRHRSYVNLDTERLRRLLEMSFGRALDAEFFDRTPLAVYVEAEYRGAAIVAHGSPVPYLSKFAVEPEAQGEGMGRDLWTAISRDYPALYWRGRAENPIASWYATVCDGMVRLPEWNVYWRGIETRQIPDVIEAARAHPADFTAPALQATR